ncbi:MAG: PD-(D/E)XK nuclease family protein [Clostridia bacterium]|nr:PD-(D/E)XK nuclease family protein [Clostridia bacterium]
MNLQILYGESSALRSRRIYKNAWQNTNSGKKTIILVPEQYTLETEKALLAENKESDGMIKIQVMSIKRLMSWIFSGIENPSGKVLDETGKILLIKTILKRHVGELKIFERAAAMPGFSSSVGDFIGDLKKFNVSADDLLEAIKGENEESIIYKKAHDIKIIMESYREASMAIGAVDSDDSVDLLCGVIDGDSAEVKKFFDNTCVYFDSFDYIPAKNIQLIFSILPYADEVGVSLTLDKQRTQSLYAAGADSMNLIEKTAENMGIRIDAEYIEGRVQSSDEGIQHIAKYLYSYPYKTFEGKTNLKIIKALGTDEEIHFAAASIVGLVGEHKIKWNVINVTCSRMEKYSSGVSRIFHQYGIPFFLDERRSVTSHPAVVWLLSALQFSEFNLREHALNMIKTQYTPLSSDDCEKFEDYCIACSIQGSMFLKDFRRGAKIYDLKYINEKRRVIINQVRSFDTAKKNTAGWAAEIYKLLERAEIYKYVDLEKTRLEDEGRLDEAAETAQSWNVIIKILDQLHVISSDDMYELDEIIKLLEESLSAVKIGVLPTGTNNVSVGDIGRTKVSGVKCTFILGANEGLLPPPLPEGAIFGDNELAELKNSGVQAGRGGEFRKSESNYNIYRALTSPEEILNISYDCSEGKECAMIVRRVLSLLPEVIIESAYIDPLTSAASAYRASASALGAIGDSRPYPDGKWKEGMAALMKHEKHREYIDKMYSFAEEGQTRHDIMQEEDGNLFASVSQLEQYAKCPFAYMITYGLQPENDPAANIEYVSSGAYLHKVMEEFGREIAEQDIENISDDEIDIMMQKKARHIAAVFEDGSFTIDAKREFLTEQLIETARRSGKVYAKGLKNSAFIPKGHELEFDKGREFGPIEIKLPDGKTAMLRGKIDRVDEYISGNNKWIRAIDYKSGKKSVDLTGLMTGENLQLFVYANALTKGGDAKAAGVFYFPLRNDYTDEGKDSSDAERLNGVFVDTADVLAALDTSLAAGQKSEIVNLTYKTDNTPRSSKAVMTPAYMDAALKAAMNTAENICVKMEQGEMGVNPLTDKATSACALCDYQNICRFGAQVYTQNQKPNEEEALEYIEKFTGGASDEMD